MTMLRRRSNCSSKATMIITLAPQIFIRILPGLYMAHKQTDGKLQSFTDPTLGWETSGNCAFVNRDYQVSAQPSPGVVILTFVPGNKDKLY